MIQRVWTAKAADEWSKEDWIAVVLSVIAYLGTAIGVALSMLLMISGFIILAVSVLVIILMHWVIDPKLKMISQEYEKKQKQYLIELEETQKWRDPN